MGISNLLPVEVLTDTNIHHNIALILSLLLTAIAWNLGTWYYGIPCSSSHTLVGSILGVGLAYSLIAENKSVSYVNWSKATDIGMSLILSPLVGFSLAIVLMYILRQVVRSKIIFKEPNTNNPPPTWIRAILLLTCTGVSFSHGSNDGQKGVGLMMLVMIAVVPSYFAINQEADVNQYRDKLVEVRQVLAKADINQLNTSDSFELVKLNVLLGEMQQQLAVADNFLAFREEEQFALRKSAILIGKSSKKLLESDYLNLSAMDKKKLQGDIASLKSLTDYAPYWIILLISLSLGLGTMIGWKRIVKTIGEKIGKQHLTYAQGASSEVVAASTIGLSTWLGLPVSTTQVLSSGIAGSMVASRGIKNLQKNTIKSIFIAWALTLPVTILLAGGLFLLFRVII
jgi:PiT family inorganic phosphate transporter